MVTTTISSQINHGIILENGNYGYTLTVSKTGGISAPNYGVYAAVEQTELFNSGTIRASEVAVDLLVKGTVHNSGLIDGTTFGVALETDGKLVNSGTISARSQYAVGLSDGGSVNNTGVITSENAGVVLGTAVHLTNSGDIHGKAFGVVTRKDDILVNTGTIYGGSNYVVGLWGNSTLANHGLVHASNIGVVIESSTLSNTGSISAQTIGVYLTTGWITNSGSISGGAVGIDLIGTAASSEWVTNSVKGVVSGGEFGVVLRGQGAHPVSMANAGTITGKVLGAYLYDAILTNSDKISGPVGVYLNNGLLIDSGTIAGTSFAVEMAGSATLSLASTAALEGAVADLAGTGTIALGSTNKNVLAGVGGSVTGISDIVFENLGSWTVKGNVAGLANGQTITDFSLNDTEEHNTLVLTGFAASIGYFSSGSDLFTLANGAKTLVLTLANSGGLRDEANGVFTENGSTYLISDDSGAGRFKPIAGSVSLISGFSSLSVTPGEGDDALGVTIGTRGTIDTSTAPAIVNPISVYSTELVNYGLVESSYPLAVQGIHAMTNAGTIIGGVSANILHNSGVLLGNVTGNNLNNTGTIVGQVAEYNVTNRGLISSGNNFAAVVIEYRTGYFSSSSEVVGTTYGVQCFGQGSSVRNFGNVYGHDAGIGMFSFSTVSNYGSIGGGHTGIDVRFDGTILNAGTISGATYAIDAEDASPPFTYPDPPMQLIVEPGAVFDGTVYDASGQAHLTLAGSTAGSLDMGISFIGFDAISFIGGSTWRLEGSRQELTAGQTITGFTVDDTLVVDGFAAISDTYATGIGLELSNGSHIVTLDIAGDFNTGNFAVARGFGNTTITETSMVAALVGNVGSTL